MRLPIFVEDVGLGPELQRRARETEPFRQVADRYQHGVGVCVFAAIDRRGRHLVVRQHFDDAFGAAL